MVLNYILCNVCQYLLFYNILLNCHLDKHIVGFHTFFFPYSLKKIKYYSKKEKDNQVLEFMKNDLSPNF